MQRGMIHVQRAKEAVALAFSQTAVKAVVIGLPLLRLCSVVPPLASEAPALCLLLCVTQQKHVAQWRCMSNERSAQYWSEAQYDDTIITAIVDIVKDIQLMKKLECA
jgi:hypothetical protein